ncbi:MAG: hypothetical protein NT027_17370 [Proteobacteria bacterium]|nr:hypothetical protein [Pseudomonadota bacterium]
MALSMSSLVNAKSITFKFRVNSSGPMIYACNAGLLHKSLASQVCTFSHNPTQSCNPGEHNCVCSDVNDNGGRDFATAKYTPWNFSTNRWSNATTTAPNLPGDQSVVITGQKFPVTNYGDFFANGNGSNVVVNPINMLATRLDAITFNLGSEVYGSEYFIDICYRGSQIEYFENNQALEHLLDAQVTASDVGSVSTNTSYTALAKPEVQVMSICDNQGQGTLRFAGVGINHATYNTLTNELQPLALLPGQIPVGTWTYNVVNDFQEHHGKLSLLSNGANFADNNSWIGDSGMPPRFCAVRYYFKETNQIERSWQRHDAEFVTWTRIHARTLGE